MKTPFDKIQFTFEQVNPALASTFLAESKGNRRVKPNTVDSYARDMANGDWLTNHQGIAFDEAGALIDGHHRLLAMVQAKATLTLLVSRGWPAKPKGRKSTTMDTVDRGVVRSLADQLELQHGIKNSRNIVRLSTTIAAILVGTIKVPKQSTGTVLRIAELYGPQFLWFSEHSSRADGLRNVNLAGVVVMGMVQNEAATRKFYEQLVTGVNLAASSPVHHLRNYILGMGESSYGDRERLRQAVAHHLALFIENKPCGSLVSTSSTALHALIAAQGDRTKIIRELFGAAPLPEPETVSKPASNAALRWDSTEGRALLKSFRGSFTALDLAARLDGGGRVAGVLLTHWRAHNWIEGAGFGQFRRSDQAPE